MYIKELSIQNFQVIRRAELSFGPDNKVIGVVARYDDPSYEGRSNRGGKSTFVDAIEYLIFGVGRKRTHVDLINRAARAVGNGMVVSGTLVLDNSSEIVVSRSCDADGNLLAEISGHEGMKWKAANQYMESVIGFTYEENRNTAYFTQGQIHKFMEAEPRDKRKLLLTWLNQERWEARRKYAKVEVDRHSNKVEALEIALRSLPEPEDSRERLEDLLIDARDELRELDIASDKYRAELIDLEGELKVSMEMIRIESRRKELNARTIQLEEKYETAVVAAKRAREIINEISIARGEFEKRSDDYTSRIDMARRKAVEVRGKANIARKQHIAIQNTGGVCPVLSEGCTRLGDAARPAIESWDELNREAQACENYVDVLTGEFTYVKEEHTKIIDRLTREHENLGDTRIEHYKSELDRIDTELEGLNEKVANVRTVEEIRADIEDRRSKLSHVSFQHGSWQQRIRGYESAIQRIEEYTKRKAKLEQDLVFWKSMLGAWSYCVYMFGNRGIPAEYIKASFETLESDVNYILNRLGSGLTVEFRPYRESKSKEKYCLVCGTEFQTRQRKCGKCGETRQQKMVEQLVLTIHDAMENQSSDFTLDGGGGKVLISFAVRLALLFLKVRTNRGEVPPIILDEIVGMLDPVNRQAIINVVVNMLTQEYGVSQIFWISHNEEILDMLENALCVTRYDDHSIVDWL